MQTYIFKINLKDNPKIIRKIEILGNSSLYIFAEAIIDAFDFDFDHCFGFFSDTSKNYLHSTKQYELFADLEDQGIEPVDSGSVKKNKVKDVFKKAGEEMLFLFDYGDNWKFIVNFENFGEKIKGKKYPKLIESKGKAPKQY
ncbi:MAG: hypothetical protein GF365_05500 [Candidatus Buchananbacteria bacterium]|nr:hypothetical protein [Candidatus Buchananbacteria bacterium]